MQTGAVHVRPLGYVASKAREIWGIWVAQSGFSSGHDLMVQEFKPCVGLCADSSEPGACFGFCVSLSLHLLHSHSVSLSKINKHYKKFKKEEDCVTNNIILQTQPFQEGGGVRVNGKAQTLGSKVQVFLFTTHMSWEK